MKKIILSIFLFSSLAFSFQQYLQTPKTVKVTASGGSPIPTAYSAIDSQSRVLTGLSNHSHVLILNTTSSDVAINVKFDSTAPSDSTGDIYVPANTGIAVDDVFVAGSVYLKSDSGSTITSGTVKVIVW